MLSDLIARASLPLIRLAANSRVNVADFTGRWPVQEREEFLWEDSGSSPQRL
jgi:hypothetical protein